MTKPELKQYKIPKATWVAFCNPETKTALFFKEFVNGGSANTPLELIMKPSKQTLLAELLQKCYTYVEPKAK
jgi:hypothetical protein